MTVEKRIQVIKLIEEMKRHETTSRKLGLEDQSVMISKKKSAENNNNQIRKEMVEDMGDAKHID